jgi:hypothetical protein
MATKQGKRQRRQLPGHSGNNTKERKTAMLKEIITVSKKADSGSHLEVVEEFLDGIATIERTGETTNRIVLTVTCSDQFEDKVASALGHLEYDHYLHIRNKAKFETKYDHLF